MDVGEQMWITCLLACWHISASWLGLAEPLFCAVSDVKRPPGEGGAMHQWSFLWT